MNRNVFILLFVAFFLTRTGFAQQIDQVNLYHEIVQADSLLFGAFNNCDSISYKKFLTNDLEFYHDLGGLTVGADKEMLSFNEICAGRNRIRRELIKSSVEVHPINDYGAVETGIHRFYHTVKGQEKVSGIYDFIHVWQLVNGQWKLARVITYGHNEMHNG